MLSQGEAQQDGSVGELISGGRDAAAAALTGLSAVVVAPLLEERFFRGYTLPWLASFLPVPAALAASSMAFAAFHGLGPGLVPFTALGAVFGGVFLATGGNLAASSLSHSVYNAAVVATLLWEASR